MNDAISASTDSIRAAVRRLTAVDECLPRYSPSFVGPENSDATALLNTALADIQARLEGLVSAMRHESSGNINNVEATVRDLFMVDESASAELDRLHAFGDNLKDRLSR